MLLGLIFYVVLDVVLYRWAVNSESNLARYVFSYFFTGTICVIPFLLFPGLYNDITMSVFSILFLVGFFIVKKKMKEIIQTSKAQEQSEFMQSGKISMSNPEVAAMINEAVSVADDMLNVGPHASMFTTNDNFNGHIFVYCSRHSTSDKHTSRYDITVVLCDMRGFDARLAQFKSTQAAKGVSHFGDDHYYEIFRSFLQKYRAFYKPSDEKFSYTTKRSILLPNSVNPEDAITKLLREEITKHCPLADWSGRILYNKALYH